jgi:hypothetical protein
MDAGSILSVFRSEKDLKLPIVKLKSMIYENFSQRYVLFLRSPFFEKISQYFIFSPRTVALPHTRRVGLCVLAFAAGWRQCGVEQSLRQLLRFNRLLIRIKIQSFALRGLP